LEYNEFALKNRFAAEDESAAQEDLDRQRAWFEEAGADLTALKAEQDALKDAAGTISDQTEYDRLGGLMQGLQQEKDELEGALQEFTDELQRKRDEQEANENARREAAEQEEKERALEAEGRAAQDRQRERERAEQDLQNMHRYIQEWHNEQDDIYRKLNETTDARKYQEYDAALRELAQRIEEEHDYIRDVKLISNNSIKLIKITRDTLTTFRPKRCNKHLRPLKAELTVSKVRERLSNRDKVKPRLPRDSMSNTTQLLLLIDHQTGLKNLLSDTRRHSMISKEKSRSSREMSKRLKR
jgi:chromosome segregation ATPase